MSCELKRRERQALEFWYQASRKFGTGPFVRPGYQTSPHHLLDPFAPFFNAFIQRLPGRSVKESLGFHWREIPEDQNIKLASIRIKGKPGEMPIRDGVLGKLDKIRMSLYKWQNTVLLGPDLSKISPGELFERGGWRYAFTAEIPDKPLFRQYCSIIVPGYRWIGALLGPGDLLASGIGAHDFNPVPLAWLGPFSHRDLTTIL